MRGGELLHVVDFSGRGAASVVRFAIPTRFAFLFRADARRLHRCLKAALRRLHGNTSLLMFRATAECDRQIAVMNQSCAMRSASLRA